MNKKLRNGVIGAGLFLTSIYPLTHLGTTLNPIPKREINLNSKNYSDYPQQKNLAVMIHAGPKEQSHTERKLALEYAKKMSGNNKVTLLLYLTDEKPLAFDSIDNNITIRQVENNHNARTYTEITRAYTLLDTKTDTLYIPQIYHQGRLEVSRFAALASKHNGNYIPTVFLTFKHHIPEQIEIADNQKNTYLPAPAFQAYIISPLTKTDLFAKACESDIGEKVRALMR